MTRNTDEPANNPPLTGETGAQTGFDTPDRKDAHQGAYSTTPGDDRVGAADSGKYEPVQVESARDITAKFDHLATRDVGAMEKAPQAPEFAGAQTVGGLMPDATVLDAAVPSAGTGIPTSTAVAVESRERAIDPNPNYTPPSDRGPAHQPEEPADLPDGETPELKSEVQGNGLNRR